MSLRTSSFWHVKFWKMSGSAKTRSGGGQKWGQKWPQNRKWRRFFENSTWFWPFLPFWTHFGPDFGSLRKGPDITSTMPARHDQDIPKNKGVFTCKITEAKRVETMIKKGVRERGSKMTPKSSKNDDFRSLDPQNGDFQGSYDQKHGFGPPEGVKNH